MLATNGAVRFCLLRDRVAGPAGLWAIGARVWAGGGQRASVVHGLSTRSAGLAPVRRTRPPFHRTPYSQCSHRPFACSASRARPSCDGRPLNGLGAPQRTIGLGEPARSVEYRQAPVGVAMHPHPRLDEVTAVRLGRTLQTSALEAHAVARKLDAVPPSSTKHIESCSDVASSTVMTRSRRCPGTHSCVEPPWCSSIPSSGARSRYRRCLPRTLQWIEPLWPDAGGGESPIDLGPDLIPGRLPSRRLVAQLLGGQCHEPCDISCSTWHQASVRHSRARLPVRAPSRNGRATERARHRCPGRSHTAPPARC